MELRKAFLSGAEDKIHDILINSIDVCQGVKPRPNVHLSFPSCKICL